MYSGSGQQPQHAVASAPSQYRPPVEVQSTGEGVVHPFAHNPMMMNYPLKDVAVPHPHDVLCGRGGATNNHLGNSHWRMLVATNKELYVTLPKRQKQLLSRSIVHAVRSQNPPGRFLQRDSQSDLWYDVGDARATEKTSQALREGAPKLRSKLKKDVDYGAEGDGESEAESSSQSQVPSETPSMMAHIVVPPPPTPGQGRVTTKKQQHQHQQQKQQEQAKGTNNSRPETSAPPPPPPPLPPLPPPVVSAPPPISATRQTIQTTTKSRHHNFPDLSSDTSPPPPPPTPLDAAGDFSFGTISIPDAPDMGLENGFSFGSVMSLDPQYRNSLRTHGGFVPMPTGLQGQDLSFGSVTMTEAEQRRVEANIRGSGTFQSNYQPESHIPLNTQHRGDCSPHPVDFGLEYGGLSTGSFMSMGTVQALASLDPSEPYRRPQTVSFGAKTVVPPQQYNHDDQDESAPEPVDFGLEHGGLSGGSLMSIGTIKLEDGGTSFGSVMSFTTRGDVPDAVDGGLDGVGTSFGSMTLSGAPPPASARTPTSFQPPDRFDVAVPTLLHQQRSRGNLLDGDSDSEDEQHSAQASIQKSADWERLKATFEAQRQAGLQSSAAVPPSLYGMKRQASPPVIPVALGRANDGSFSDMPPPAARTQEDWRSYEASMLNRDRGDSLAVDGFNLTKRSDQSNKKR